MTNIQGLHDLIRLTGDGDPTAFEALYMEMRLPLMKYILNRYGYTLTKEDAEDIIHTLFVRLPEKASQFKGVYNEASAKKWLYTITKNEALRLVNAKRKMPNLQDGLAVMEKDTEKNPAAPERSLSIGDLIWEGEYSVEERALNATFLKMILGSIQSMTLEERTILKLRFVDGFTFEQIGRFIGRTKPRAKQIVDRLIERIREVVGVEISKDERFPSNIF